MILVSGEGHEVLAAARFATEEALGLSGLHMAQIQERPVSLFGGAAAAEVDRVSALVENPAAVGQRAEHGAAGIPVAIVLVVVEPLARRALVDVQKPDAAPAAHSLSLGQHQRSLFGSPGVAPGLDPVFGPEDLFRFCGKGRTQAHEPVAMGDFGHGITAVEGLDPSTQKSE